MQSTGQRAPPGPKFRPDRACCGARNEAGGIVLGSEETIAMHYALDAALIALLEVLLLTEIDVRPTRFHEVPVWART